ncbi:MAG: hypothetical protein JWM99_3923 [Verrucomicrobiales bacterium]|nr:hypothetical protein [Verrucomicrobiales bacterium]
MPHGSTGNRPVHEVLFSRDQELAMGFENEFRGMARIPVELTALVEARQRLRRELRSRLTPTITASSCSVLWAANLNLECAFKCLNKLGMLR